MLFEVGFLVQLIEVDFVFDLGDLVAHVLPGGFAAEAADPEFFPIELQFGGVPCRGYLDKRQQGQKWRFYHPCPMTLGR